MALTSARTLVGVLVVTLIASLVGLPTPVSAAQAYSPDARPVRWAGQTRTETATAVSAALWPDGADTVVLVRADEWADAVTGAPLAAALDAPVLLTATDHLPDTTVAELDRLRTRTVIVLGGVAAVQDRVLDTLRQTGLTVRRIHGPDRYGTATAIAQAHADLAGATSEVMLASGEAWSDALVAAAHAARAGLPLLLTRPDQVPAPTGAALAHESVSGVTVVGTVTAVAPTIVDTVHRPGRTVRRITGTTGDAVAISLAGTAAPAGQTLLVSATSWPDTLVAAAAAARADAIVLPVDRTHLHATGHTAAWLDAHPSVVAVIGGTSVVADTVLAALTDQPAPPAGDRWSDPQTWGGSVPAAGDIVTVPADRTIVLDHSPPPLAGLRIEGTLLVTDQAAVTLNVGWIHLTGLLQAGTETRRHPTPFTITLTGSPDDELPVAGARAISVDGGRLELHGTPEPTRWTRLARTAPAGTTTIEVDQTAGWDPGDLIVIASTSHDPGQAERRHIVTVGQTTITLDEPLTHTHWGDATTVAGHRIAERAEVGLLTRTIRIQGPEGEMRFGGHVLAHTGATLRIEDVELVRMGQAGILGRYPIHWHRMGDTTGNYLRSSVIRDSFNRCVTVHATNGVTVADNVADDAAGHCFFVEDGVEHDNAFLCNLGLTTRRPPEDVRLLESDKAPATFWISNPDNHLVGNVAAGSWGNGFWYDLPSAPTGASVEMDIDPREAPFGTFLDNVAHSTAKIAGFRSGAGLSLDHYDGPDPAHIDRFTTYSNSGFGIWAEFNAHVSDPVIANSAVGIVPRSGRRDQQVSVTGGIVAASTREDPGPMNRQVGIGSYHDHGVVSDVALVGFRPTGRVTHASPAGPVTLTSVGLVTFRRMRVLNSDPVMMSLPDPSRQVSIAIVDLDGTLTGHPQTVTGNSPLIADSRCRPAPMHGGWTCPVDHAVTSLRLQDPADEEIPWTVTRTDGAQATGRTAVVLGHHYTATFPALPHVVVGSTSTVPGHVTVAIPTVPGPVWVYRGFDRSATALAATDTREGVTPDTFWRDDKGDVHVKLDTYDRRHTRVQICNSDRCGGIISAR